MAQGSGSAVVGAVLVSLLLLQCSEVARVATYTVGDAQGWSFNVASWPDGKHFRAGDTLVFNYSPAAHSVVPVNSVNYDQCITPRGARVFQTGKDRITLVKGHNFFICGVPGHCQAGRSLLLSFDQ